MNAESLMRRVRLLVTKTVANGATEAEAAEARAAVPRLEARLGFEVAPLTPVAPRLGIGVTDKKPGYMMANVNGRENSIAGIAVHIGARVVAFVGPGEVLVSSTIRELVMVSGIGFVDHGTHSLKGVPGEWRLLLALRRWHQWKARREPGASALEHSGRMNQH